MRNRHSSVSASVVQLAEHRICNPDISVRFRSEALLEFTCGCCGTAFTSHDRRRRYCGRTCAARVNNVGVARNRTTGRHATKPCQHCGRPTRNPNFCSITCSAAAQHARAQAAIARTGRFRSPHSARVYVADRDGWRCSICGRSTWMGRRVPLVLDHINGNPDDNRIDNMRLVCGNCDMQLPTYKSRNRGRGRAWRRARYANGLSY